MTTIKSAAVSAASKANAATRTRDARGHFEPVALVPPAAIEAAARSIEAPPASEALADRPKGRAWGRMRRDR